MMTYSGDVKLYPTSDGGDILLVGGQPDMDAGLWTAVYISLFSSDWWGNAISEGSEQLLDGLDSIDGTVTPALRKQIEVRARALLQWLVDDGAAQSVDVEATIPTPTRIDVTISITQPDGAVSVRTFDLNWANTTEGLGI